MDTASGGFLPPGPLLSPPPSSTTSAVTQVSLPQARKTPLKPGSNKEAELLRYLDEKILDIQRRFAKRGTETQSSLVHVRPYRSFREAARDISSLIDMIWMSGTPRLQIPFYLTLALLVADYLPAFAPSAKVTLSLLDKLDFVFASLLQGRNVNTGEVLTGFEGGRVVSVTEKVRIKSLVEQTRIRVVKILGDDFGTDASNAAGEDTATETDDEPLFSEDYTNPDNVDDVSIDAMQLDSALDQHEIEISKVYDRTVVELGDVLGGTPIGIVTDD